MKYIFTILTLLIFFNLPAQKTRIVGAIDNNFITSFDSSYVIVEECNYGNLGYVLEEFLEIDAFENSEKLEIFYLFSEDMSVGVIVNAPRDRRICTTTTHYDGILLSKRYYPRY